MPHCVITLLNSANTDNQKLNSVGSLCFIRTLLICAHGWAILNDTSCHSSTTATHPIYKTPRSQISQFSFNYNTFWHGMLEFNLACMQSLVKSFTIFWCRSTFRYYSFAAIGLWIVLSSNNCLFKWNHLENSIFEHYSRGLWTPISSWPLEHTFKQILKWYILKLIYVDNHNIIKRECC